MTPLPQVSRGPVKDLWDMASVVRAAKVSLALLVIVGLFSIEWLTRKLLGLRSVLSRKRAERDRL